MILGLLLDVGVVAILICYDCWNLIINCIVRLLLSGLILRPALASFFSALMSIDIGGMKLNCVQIFLTVINFRTLFNYVFFPIVVMF